MVSLGQQRRLDGTGNPSLIFLVAAGCQPAALGKTTEEPREARGADI
jgi:hypothetical protein